MIPPISRSQYKFFYPTLIVVGTTTSVVILLMPVGPILKTLLLAGGLTIVFVLNPISTGLVSNAFYKIKGMISDKSDQPSVK